MDGSDAGEAAEVSGVEGQEMGEAVDPHRGDKARVVHLNAGNGMGNQEPSPLLVNRRTVGKEDEATLNASHPPIGLGHRQAKASSCRYRAGADIPELTKNLRCETEAVPSGP
jgi:hypothetical protein